MTTDAGWNSPEWLPASVRRAQYLEAQAEAREAREAEAEREEAVEQRRAQALTQAAREAEARGETLDVMALARGEVRGRAVSEILTAAVEASAAADRGDQLRLQREGTGAPVHIQVGEPRLHRAPAARSARALEMFHRYRRFREARRAAEAALNGQPRRRATTSASSAISTTGSAGTGPRRHGTSPSPTSPRGDYLYDKDYGVIRPVSYR